MVTAIVDKSRREAGRGGVVPPAKVKLPVETGKKVGLGVLPGDNASHAMATSANGSVIVGFSNSPGGGGQAFRWKCRTSALR